MTFWDDYHEGHVDAGALDDYVDAWCDSGDDETRDLYEYLGMTWEQWRQWGSTGELPERGAP